MCTVSEHAFSFRSRASQETRYALLYDIFFFLSEYTQRSIDGFRPRPRPSDFSVSIRPRAFAVHAKRRNPIFVCEWTFFFFFLHRNCVYEIYVHFLFSIKMYWTVTRLKQSVRPIYGIECVTFHTATEMFDRVFRWPYFHTPCPSTFKPFDESVRTSYYNCFASDNLPPTLSFFRFPVHV